MALFIGRFKLNPKKIWRIFIIIGLPAFSCAAWYFSEFKQIEMQNFETHGGYQTPKGFLGFVNQKKIDYDAGKNNYPVDFQSLPSKIQSEKALVDFKGVVSQKILGVDIFSLFPIYLACLKNNNVVYVENEKMNNLLDPAIGAIGIEQQQANYKFYSRIGNVPDCKNAYKDKFTGSFRVEYSYSLNVDLGPEDTKKMCAGEDFRIYLKSFRLDTSKSSFVLRPRWWAPFALFLLFAGVWSIIWFYILKIWDYINTGKH